MKKTRFFVIIRLIKIIKMRIEENNQNISSETNESANKVKPDQTRESEANPKKSRRIEEPISKQKGEGNCLKLFGCFCLMLLTILVCTICLIFFFIGPMVKRIDELPKDFTKQIVLYQLDKAKIKIQTPADKDKVRQLIRALPTWALSPFLGYLSTEIKTQILADNKEAIATENLTATDLEKTLNQQDSQNNKTISLSWDNLNKTKEDLFEYYKNQLLSNGFSMTENISDSEIKLVFLKEGITGAMSIMDSFSKDGNSLIKMTVNYMNGN